MESFRADDRLQRVKREYNMAGWPVPGVQLVKRSTMINSAKVAEELKNEGGWVGSRNETTKTLFAFSLIYFYHAVFYFAPFN